MKKFKLYDYVLLNTELEEPGERGIHKGCRGVIVQYGEDKSLVLFFNKKDIGDYAFAWVKNNNLDFYGEHDKYFLDEFIAF